jgi:hypothetical protein
MRLLIVALLLLSISSFAQKKKEKEESLLKENAEWFEGTIMLTDGTELKGLLKYTDQNGVLSFQDGTNSKVLTATRVVGFEFFDESLQKQRVFYTLAHEDSQTNVVRPLFFEVVREYSSFAILSKTDPVDVEQKLSKNPMAYSPNAINLTSNRRLVVSQEETIYLMNAQGEIKPYFKMVNEENKGLLATGDVKTKNKMVDDDLLIEFVTEPIYEKLKTFAKQNNLTFKRKEDFLKILDHYDSIRSK